MFLQAVTYYTQSKNNEMLINSTSLFLEMKGVSQFTRINSLHSMKMTISSLRESCIA